jgi:transcriptional regulator with XRE-family HTH domain
MSKLNTPFKDGIGTRLQEERKRNGFSQTQLADIVGIGKMTQFQYEKGINLPTLKYLSSIIPTGVDIQYILFGVRTNSADVQEWQKKEIEKKALSMLAKNEAELGNMDDDKRYLMFTLLVSQLTTSMAQGNLTKSSNEKD